MSELWDYKYQEEPRITVRVTYIDDSTKDFDNEEWLNFKDGIKKNLYDKGKVKDVKIV